MEQYILTIEITTPNGEKYNSRSVLTDGHFTDQGVQYTLEEMTHALVEFLKSQNVFEQGRNSKI